MRITTDQSLVKAYIEEGCRVVLADGLCLGTGIDEGDTREAGAAAISLMAVSAFDRAAPGRLGYFEARTNSERGYRWSSTTRIRLDSRKPATCKDIER